MSDGNEYAAIVLIVMILSFLFGCAFVSSHNYNVYIDGVEDGVAFCNQYNCTEHEINTDFWVEYGMDKYYDHWFEFKEVYLYDK